MTYPSALGLSGVAGAGKDTTYERLVALGGDRFVRFSIADPMKDSIAALFGVSLERLDELKRDPRSVVSVRGQDPDWVAPPGEGMAQIPRGMTFAHLSMREFMQRYGTEAHREIFGDDFWLKHWLRQVEAMRYGPDVDPLRRPTIVNTSVRFPNEAEAILALPGGEVWQIVGPQDEGAAGHPSETPLPPGLVTRYIDNSSRTVEHCSAGFGMPDRELVTYTHLDDQIALIVDEWKRA